MNCQTAQCLLDDLARERLAESDSVAVRQHLADCTDCRVVAQRAARLQRLLALKRHEQPAPQYFDNFLAEFHRRQRAAATPQPAWWEHALASAREGFARIVSVELSTAAAVALVAVGLWLGVRGLYHGSQTDNNQVSSFNQPFHVGGAIVMPQSVPELGGVSLPAAERTDPTEPRYVLDRLVVTPASYDGPEIHF